LSGSIGHGNPILAHLAAHSRERRSLIQEDVDPHHQLKSDRVKAIMAYWQINKDRTDSESDEDADEAPCLCLRQHLGFKDLLRRIKQNSPPIESLEIECLIDYDDQEATASIGSKYFKLSLINVDEWRMLDNAIKNNRTLKKLQISRQKLIEEVGQFTVPPKTAQCLKEIYKG
jgi:hypothetical protein